MRTSVNAVDERFQTPNVMVSGADRRPLHLKLGADLATPGLQPHGVQKGTDLMRRPQVVDSFLRPSLGNELSVFRGQVSMT